MGEKSGEGKRYGHVEIWDGAYWVGVCLTFLPSSFIEAGIFGFVL
jgi:hypothetical protein